MDLRTGETVWLLKNGPPLSYPPLDRDANCDAVIVGGGITGAFIARELVAAGMDCVMIDRREPGGGSTPASTALLLYELDTPLWKLARQIGEEDAAASYRACVEAIGKIEAVVHDLHDACDFTRRKSFYLAEHAWNVPGLKREAEIRRKHGIATDFLRRSEVEERFSFSRPGALLSHDAAEIDVLRLVAALQAAAVERGLRIHGKTALKSFTSSPGKCVVLTEAGAAITARHLVFATGYESEKYLGRTIGTLKSTYAIATQPLDEFSGWHERSLIWTTARPYLYLRTTSDGRAVVGGGDIDYKNDKVRDALLPKKTAVLEKELRKLFPELDFEIACCWAGTFGETPDSLARIGSPPGCANVHFALGYGGNGITYSMIAAEIIRDACLGRFNPDSRLFRLDR